MERSGPKNANALKRSHFARRQSYFRKILKLRIDKINVLYNLETNENKWPSVGGWGALIIFKNIIDQRASNT